VYAVSFSPDGAHLVSSSRDQTVRLWNIETGDELRQFTGHEHVIWDVRFDVAGERVASASWDRTLRVWNVVTGKLVRLLEGHDGAVYGVAFSPDGKQVVSSASDRTVRLWDLDDGETRVVAELSGRGGVPSFHPDGRRVAVPVSDGTTQIFDISTGDKVVVRGHTDQTTVATWSPNGKRLGSIADDGNVRVWEEDGRPYWRAPVLLRRPARILSHRGWNAIDEGIGELPGTKWRQAVEANATFADAAPEGELLCVSTYDSTVELWDLGSDRRLADRKVEGLEQVFATAGGCVVRGADGVFLLRGDAETPLASGATEAIGIGVGTVLIARGESISVLDPAGDPLGKHNTGVGVTALTRNARFVAVGFRDGTLEARRASDDSPPPTDFFEQLPAGPVTRLVLGPMDTLIAGYAGGTVAMWNLHDGVRLAHARLHGPVSHLVLDGQKLYAATGLGRSLVWDLDVFSRDYCDVMREVWREIPVMWDRGRPVPAPAPPEDHACR
jgi:WD40 repeat protein